MLLKVKYDELKKITNTIKNDCSLFDEEIKRNLEQIEKLRGIWQGNDSDIFCNNVHDYLQKMTTISATLRNLEKFIDKANNGYKDNDESFSRELDTEVDNYEENIDN